MKVQGSYRIASRGALIRARGLALQTEAAGAQDSIVKKEKGPMGVPGGGGVREVGGQKS